MNDRLIDEAVDHPAHYTFGTLEVIDAIEAWDLGFHLGNVVKYVARSAHKGNELEDLKKARWYLDRKIARLTTAAETLRDRKSQRVLFVSPEDARLLVVILQLEAEEMRKDNRNQLAERTESLAIQLIRQEK